MRKAINYIWFIIFGSAAAVYLISCISPFIKPQAFGWSNFFSIGFPYLFAVMLAASTFQIFLLKKGFYVLVIVLLAGAYNLSNLFAIGKRNFSIEKDKNNLRVLSWNVESFYLANYFGRDSSKLQTYFDVVETYRPDVICFQEYTENFIKSKPNAIEKYLRKKGYHFKAIAMDSASINNKFIFNGIGLAIFSKLPVSDVKTVGFNTGEAVRHMLSANISFEKQMISVNTFHLLSYRIDRRKEAFQKESTLKYTLCRLINVSRKQDMQAEKYLQAVSTNNARIICGDFNNVPTSFLYNKLKKNMQDAFLKGAWGFGITFPNFLRTLRIDHIFVGKAMKISQTKIIESPASDHYPVVTDVSPE